MLSTAPPGMGLLSHGGGGPQRGSSSFTSDSGTGRGAASLPHSPLLVPSCNTRACTAQLPGLLHAVPTCAQSCLHLAMSQQKNQPHKQTSQPQLQTAGLAVSSGVHGQARGWGWQVGRQVSGRVQPHHSQVAATSTAGLSCGHGSREGRVFYRRGGSG